MQLVGITGRKRHGKDTVAREFVAQGFSVVRFADPLKAMLRAFYATHDMLPADIERRLEGDLKEVPCEFLNGNTPRHAMQTLGTEWGRNLIDAQLWIDSFKRRMQTKSKVAVPDVRFANECAAVHDLGGRVLRVDASGRIPDDRSTHSSETEIGQLPADFEIDNNGTPFELSCAVKAALGFST